MQELARNPRSASRFRAVAFTPPGRLTPLLTFGGQVLADAVAFTGVTGWMVRQPGHWSDQSPQVGLRLAEAGERGPGLISQKATSGQQHRRWRNSGPMSE